MSVAFPGDTRPLLGSKTIDPGSIVFDPINGLVSPGNATDMIYEYLSPGIGPFFQSLDPAGLAVNLIIFTPNAGPIAPNYDYIAL